MEFRPRLVHYLSSAIALVLAACGGGNMPGPSGSDGGVDGGPVLAPGQILPGRTVAGTSASGEPLHYYVDLAVAASYAIQVAGTDYGLTLSVYSNSQRTQLAATCSSVFDAALCFANLQPGRYYVTADPDYFSSGSFTFAITPMVNEGTSTDPAPLYADPNIEHTVATLGSSYYRFDAPVSGAYDLGFSTSSYYSGLSALTLTLFASPTFTGTPLGSCSGQTACMFSGIPAGPVYVRVDALDTAPGMFRMAPVHTLGEGAAVDPIAIDGTPKPGAVDLWSESYYSFTTGAAGTYLLQFGGTTLTNFRASAHDGAVTDTPASSCSGSPCALSGLDAATTYLVVVEIYADVRYDLSVTPGLCVGSSAQPSPITASTPVVGQIDDGGTSYYAFTPTVSAYHRVTAPTLPAGTTVWLSFTRAGNAYRSDCTLSATQACSLGPVEAGVPFAIEVSAPAGSVTDFSLVVEPEPYGEGIPSDPVMLDLGVDHPATMSTTFSNYYRFVADSTGGDYQLLISARDFVSVSPTAGCVNVGNANRTVICTFTGLAPNAVVAFSTSTLSSVTNRDIVLRVDEIGVSTGCEPGSLACYDFESGSVPADLAVSGSKPFKASTAAALRGSYGFENGTTLPSCFTFTTPATARAVSFSSELYSLGTYDGLDISVDGAYPTRRYATTTSGLRQRSSIGLATGTTHTVQFCWDVTVAAHHAYLDDIAVR